MNPSEVTGVILAAGKGTRMYPFSKNFPKPILPICNQPLIKYHIEEMKKMGIANIVIVIGHLGHEIIKLLGDGSQLGVKIEYIPQREMMGIAHAVGELEEYLAGSFLLFLGDIYFWSNQLKNMFELMDRETHAVLAVRKGESPEAIRKNFAIVVDDDGIIKRVIEKPRFPPNNVKGCGIYLFSQAIFDAIRRTPRTAARNEYEITESIQILINDGLIVRAAEVIDFDVNLTSPCDLLDCNLAQLRLEKKEKLIGDDCVIENEGVEISNSVLGGKVTLLGNVNISDSLIFPDVTLDFGGEINQMIITKDDAIDCRFAKRAV